jgi:hypothetical protein
MILGGHPIVYEFSLLNSNTAASLSSITQFKSEHDSIKIKQYWTAYIKYNIPSPL